MGRAAVACQFNLLKVVGSSPAPTTTIMKVLNLIIKQKYFDEILAGTKTEEFREVRPTTFKKYLRYMVDGEEFEDLDDVPDEPRFNQYLDERGFDVNPIAYDALRLYVGYNKNRDSMLVEVTSVVLEHFVDEENNPIYYEYKGNEYVMSQMVYGLGKIIETDIHPKKR